MTRLTLFLVVAACVFLILAGTVIYFSRRLRKAASTELAPLLRRLHAIDRDGIAIVACNFLEEGEWDGTFPALEREDIWNLLGGMQGLEALQANCEVLIELAFQLQQVYPATLVVSEELRRNAREIQWHVERLKGAAQTGHLRAYFPDYAQRVAATYFKMTRSVLQLYMETDAQGFIELQSAL